jgi:hydrogenase maturation protease
MRKVLIGGIGNVLLSDDGIGPYIVRMLASRYEFSGNVELADLGTPGLELIDYLMGKDTVVLIDSAKSNQRPGTILVYRKPDIVKNQEPARNGPHAPSLANALLTQEEIGTPPKKVVLVAVVGQTYEIGCGLSESVRMSVESVMATVVHELSRMHLGFEPRQTQTTPDIWWEQEIAFNATDVEKPV